MDNETNIVKECIQSLSQDMKDYLAKDAWPQKLSDVAQINKINEEQAFALKAEVFLILIGVENYSDLRENIKKNIIGIGSESIENIANDIEKNIFSEIKPSLVEIEKANKEVGEENTNDIEKNLSKDNVLKEIENPVPTKPIVSNPAGKNVVLDAQHNLPEQEKKILISSAAVPSRGPILGSVKSGFAPAPAAQTIPVPTPIPKATITPAVVPTNPTTPKPIQPASPAFPQQTQSPQPISQKPATTLTPMSSFSQPRQPMQPIQPQKPPQAHIPPAPAKYTVDPYREPV